MTHSLPILYSFRRCPYCMRARLALYQNKIHHELREISLKDKPQEMLEISPKGTVPVLLLSDGRILEQSLDIMNWALNSPPLLPFQDQLIHENDTTFKHALDRYKYPNRYEEENEKFYRDQCETFLIKLEGLLSPFIHGASPGLSDMAIFPFVRQFSMVDPEWFHERPYPALKNWLNYFLSSDLFNQIMKENSLWFSGQEPILIKF